MNVQAEKYKLIEWITSLEDTSLIQLLQSIQQKTNQNTFGFSDVEKKKILEMLEKSEADIQNGRTFTHENVMNEFREQYGIGK
jgi:predicted transcriptional regulator